MFISNLHVGVSVHSLQGSIRFYTGLLGLSVHAVVRSNGLGGNLIWLPVACRPNTGTLSHTNERAEQKS